MSTWSGRVRRIARTSPDALAEGSALLPLVRGLAEDRLAWVAVVVREEHIDLVDPRPAGREGPEVARFLAGLSRSVTSAGPARAVGIAGNLQVRVGVRRAGRVTDRGVPVSVVFLEAPDCDWWMWQRFAGSSDDEHPPAEQVLAARHGDPLPGGLGRWWSLGRRTGVRVVFGGSEQAIPPVATSPLIH